MSLTKCVSVQGFIEAELVYSNSQHVLAWVDLYMSIEGGADGWNIDTTVHCCTQSGEIAGHLASCGGLQSICCQVYTELTHWNKMNSSISIFIL